MKYDIELIEEQPRLEDRDLNALANAHEPYYHFLYNLARLYADDIEFVVVLGVHQAVCCAHICHGLDTGDSGAIVMGVDQHIIPEAAEIQSICRNRMVLVNGVSIDSNTLSAIESVGFPIDVVFFDTIHTYRQVIGEYNTLKHLLADEAVLIFDDVHAAEDQVLKAVNEIPGTYYDLDWLHEILGFGVKIWRR